MPTPLPKISTGLASPLSELLKHFTTLSAGSIVLSASFIEKLSNKLHYKGLLIFAIGSFMACILIALITHFWLTLIIDNEVKDSTGSKMFRYLFASTLFGCLLAFGTGMSCAGFFVISNL
jgi:hypothetical protein